MTLSLRGRNILVTGVSRPMGIGGEITRVLAEAGANVAIHGYARYDRAQAYRDAQTDYAEALVAEISAKGQTVCPLPGSDLSAEGAPEEVIAGAVRALGHLDGLVLNHAYSTFSPVGEWTRADIEKHLSVNVTAAMLMIQSFAAQLPEGARGAVTLFTSGQYLGPMTGEIPYAVSKEAIIGLCKQASAALAPKRISVNCVNPGPTDTGYLFGAAYEAVAKQFPFGRWGTANDAARLVHFLQSDYAAWITGEVIASEGGFRRDAPGE